MHFPCLRIRRDRRIRLGVHQICDHGLCLALSDPAYLHHLRIDPFRFKLIQIGCDIPFEHRHKLVGRSRKKDRSLSVRFYDQPRRSSIMIIYDLRALRNHSLLPVIRCHLAAPYPPEILLDPLLRMLILIQLPAKYLRGHFFCQVILRRSKPSAQDQDIRPRQAQPDRFHKPFFIVSHHTLVIAG